jgi:hypothetical protein
LQRATIRANVARFFTFFPLFLNFFLWALVPVLI